MKIDRRETDVIITIEDISKYDSIKFTCYDTEQNKIRVYKISGFPRIFDALYSIYIYAGGHKLRLSINSKEAMNLTDRVFEELYEGMFYKYISDTSDINFEKRKLFRNIIKSVSYNNRNYSYIVAQKLIKEFDIRTYAADTFTYLQYAINSTITELNEKYEGCFYSKYSDTAINNFKDTEITIEEIISTRDETGINGTKINYLMRYRPYISSSKEMNMSHTFVTPFFIQTIYDADNERQEIVELTKEYNDTSLETYTDCKLLPVMNSNTFTNESEAIRSKEPSSTLFPIEEFKIWMRGNYRNAIRTLDLLDIVLFITEHDKEIMAPDGIDVNVFMYTCTTKADAKQPIVIPASIDTDDELFMAIQLRLCSAEDISLYELEYITTLIRNDMFGKYSDYTRIITHKDGFEYKTTRAKCDNVNIDAMILCPLTEEFKKSKIFALLCETTFGCSPKLLF